MNMLFSPMLRFVGVAIIVLSTLGYIKVLHSDKKALEASVELHKRDAEINAIKANDNAKLYLDMEWRYNMQQEKLMMLQSDIDKIKNNQHSNEKEIIKYVNTLPEGFEKSCLNMSVPNSISGMSNN